MKHLCCSKLLLLLLLVSVELFASLNQKSAMIYYGDKISYPSVGIHDYIIVQPSKTIPYTHGFKMYANSIYAYVSVGEVHLNETYYPRIKEVWKVGHNTTWNSTVLDIINPQYQDFLLNDVLEPLHVKGYKNFFFDTLDSYQLIAKSEGEREAYKESLIDFIHKVHKKFPRSKLILNRGFELLDDVHSDITAIVFESFHFGLSPSLEYTKVSKNDQQWLLTHIKKAQGYNVDVIGVDYLDPSNLSKANEAIEAMNAYNIIGYVGNRDLDIYGISTKNALKREVLMVYDSNNLDKSESAMHLYASLIIEYLGYRPKLYDIKNGLPNADKMQQYAGVMVWLQKYYKHQNKFFKWLLHIKDKGIHTLLLDNFTAPISLESLDVLDINVTQSNSATLSKNSISYKDAMMDFEVNASINQHQYLLHPKQAKALLRYTNENNESSTLAAITPWGGYAMDESLMITLNDENLWVINPFKLFREALRLKPIPAADVTTENGLRLMSTHVDGDGIMNRVEFNPELFSGDSIYDYILTQYDFPHSISIVEAESAVYGKFPKTSKAIENIVQKIYQLDNVESATHTFTHPYKWDKIVNNNLDKQYRIDVKDYNFSVDRELAGSLSYVNSLAPKDKASRMIFWSGNCIPQETVLDYVYAHNFTNINAGDTYITNDKPWLSYISPLGIFRGEFEQTYTGAQNENVYTNDWLGPFWAFKKVIQTFELTNSPRRLKPIDIYYHFYAGSKRASLNALIEVFEWVKHQNIMPIYTSEYLPKVQEFYDFSMAQDGNRYLVKGIKNLRTFRVAKHFKRPVITPHSDVIGYNKSESGTYISLYPSHNTIMNFSAKREALHYIIDANAKLISKQFYARETHYHFKAHIPLHVDLHVNKRCSFTTLPKADTIYHNNNMVSINYTTQKEATINVRCK